MTDAAKRDGIPLHSVEAFEALPGRGTKGVIHGQIYHLGNHRLIHEQGQCSDELESRLSALEEQGETVILLTNEHSVHGLFAIADTVKNSSRQAIAELHALGIKTVMLTGDNRAAAEDIGKALGIEKVYSELLPPDKVAVLEDMISGKQAGRTLAFVGDGINDAPVLARADVGIAMGGLGSDAAIEAADVVIMTDEPSKVPIAIRIAKMTLRIVKQNIAFAISIKVLVLLLGAMGMATMWEAVFADVGVTVLVVANSFRTLRS